MRHSKLTTALLYRPGPLARALGQPMADRLQAAAMPEWAVYDISTELGGF